MPIVLNTEQSTALVFTLDSCDFHSEAAVFT